MKLSKFILIVYSFISAQLFSYRQNNANEFIVKFIRRPKFWLIICLSLISLAAFSQGTETGCLLPNNIVYTTSFDLLGKKYNGNSGKPLSANYCSWTPTSIVSCTVCFGANLGIACLGSSVPGVEGTFTMVPCPLNDYLPIFTLIAAGTGAYYIARKKMYVKT